jgi:hypothetical protein
MNMCPEGLPQEVTFQDLRVMYYETTNKSAIHNLITFTLLQDVLEMASTFTDTQLCFTRKINSRAFGNSVCIIYSYFACKLPNLKLQFLCSIDCTGIALDF